MMKRVSEGLAATKGEITRRDEQSGKGVELGMYDEAANALHESRRGGLDTVPYLLRFIVRSGCCEEATNAKSRKRCRRKARRWCRCRPEEAVTADAANESERCRRRRGETASMYK